MSFTLEVFIARSDVLDSTRGLAPVIVPVRLPRGFVLVPVTNEVHDLFAPPLWRRGRTPPPSALPPYPELFELSPALAAWAREVSVDGPIAYLEADLFGGAGSHAAIVWSDGEIVLGPLRTENKWEGAEFVGPPTRENAFNRALRHLGVVPGDTEDEFDALTLGRHRSTDDWLKKSV
jgi:hypothetical protein